MRAHSWHTAFAVSQRKQSASTSQGRPSRQMSRARFRDVRDVHETAKGAASSYAVTSSTNLSRLTAGDSLRDDVRHRPLLTKIERSNLCNRENRDLKLAVVVLAEAGGNERAGLRGTDGLARTGFGENDVPEIGVWRAEGDPNKAPLPLLPQGSDMTLGRFGRHLIENPDVLPGDERRIH